MKILVNNTVNFDNWQAILANSTFNSPFQTYEFYKFFNSLEGFSANVIAIEDNEEIKALAVITIQKEMGLKSYFSRRGIIYGGPVLGNDGANYVDELLHEITKLYNKRLIYIETRNYFDYSAFRNIFENNNYKYLPWLNFQLDCSDLDGMKKSVSDSRMRQIKKAIKNGVVWQEAESDNEVIAFYKILHDLYKNKIKKPLLPQKFFTEFFKQNLGKFLLVYFENKIIGGIMCPISEGKAIYEFYVCGLDNDYKNQFPSVMATWAAMEYANKNNIPLFDFMGAGSPDEDYGVRDFKARFGGRLVDNGRYLKILNPLLYSIGKLGLKVLSKIR